MYAPSNDKYWIGYFIYINDVFWSKIAAALWASFYTVGTNGLNQDTSSTFQRRKPWQNLIDVAEYGRNITRRERSQQNVAGTRIAAVTIIAAKSKIIGSIKTDIFRNFSLYFFI